MVFSRSRRASRKQPREKVDGGDGHANAEQDAREHAFRAAVPEGEGEAGYDNRDDRQPARDGAGERLLENTHGVLPGRIGGRLGRGRCGEEQSHDRCRENPSRTTPIRNSSPTYFHFETSQRVLKNRRKFTPETGGRGHGVNLLLRRHESALQLNVLERANAV